jgi:4-amino-4-deoxy-L-arabinose transferase-like glycosyltransferase
MKGRLPFARAGFLNPGQNWQTGLALVIILYLSLSFYQLDLPGLHYDEAFEAVPALQLLLGQPVAAFRGSGLTLGGQTYPFMTQDYIGALNTYLAAPFIAVLGPTPAALRTASILVGLVTLTLTYLLAYRLTGRHWVGLAAVLLLAVEPTFIFWNRQGIFVTASTAAIGLGSAYCWLCRLQQAGRPPSSSKTSTVCPGGAGWSIGGAFLFGLGLYTKLLFLWLIIALAGALILLNLSRLSRRRPHLLPALKQVSPIEITLAGLAFFLGCAPLLAYNLQTGGTLLSLSQNASTSYYGVDNFAFAANLLERLGQLLVLLDGGHLWYLGGVVVNWLVPLFFSLVLVVVIILTTRSCFMVPNYPQRRSFSQSPFSPVQAALLPFLIIGLVTLASIITVSALWITHFAILMPWPALAIAIGSWFILDQTRAETSTGQQPGVEASAGQPGQKTRFLKILISLGLALLVITNLSSTLRYHHYLSRSGGLSSHSDAIYDLSVWLDHHARGRPVVAMDWGLAAPVAYLTRGRVNPTEIFGYAWQSDLQLGHWLGGYIAQPDTLYLWRAPDEIIFDRSADFKALYRPQMLEETIVAAFYEKSGRPLLGITRLVPCGAPGIIPPDPSPYCH